MQIDLFDWDDEDVPNGNSWKVRANGLTREEVEELMDDPAARDGVSRSTGRPTRYGFTATGRPVVVVYTILCRDPLLIVRVVTSYVPDEE